MIKIWRVKQLTPRNEGLWDFKGWSPARERASRKVSPEKPLWQKYLRKILAIGPERESVETLGRLRLTLWGHRVSVPKEGRGGSNAIVSA